jgi:hypothetical protein
MGNKQATSREFGRSWLFDPTEGVTIVSPAGTGSGNWAGAPGVIYDPESARFYLSYRVRKPQPIRGGECYVAASEDGVHFDVIWSATKGDFGSPSVERFGIAKAPDGSWLLYPSYVDPADNRWRIDVIQADHPSAFDVGKRQKVFTAAELGVEGVKDPWVMRLNGFYYMLISYAIRMEQLSADQEQRMHATADIYNTGLTLSSSAMAVSQDGLTYEWLGDVFPPRAGAWDGYAARLGCVIATDYGWIGYYDGSASVEGNYEERTGLAQSWDLRHFQRLTFDGPALVSPHASGCLRYIDAVPLEDEILLYYEYCRADGSHELRMNRLPR